MECTDFADQQLRVIDTQLKSVTKSLVLLVHQYGAPVKLYHNNHIDPSGSWLIVLSFENKIPQSLLEYPGDPNYSNIEKCMGTIAFEGISELNDCVILKKPLGNQLLYLVLNSRYDETNYFLNDRGVVLQRNRLTPQRYLITLVTDPTFASTNEIKSIAVSSINTTFASSFFSKIVTGHGYFDYPTTVVTKQGSNIDVKYKDAIDSCLGKSFDDKIYWQKRSNKGCRLSSNCICSVCTQEDHYSCITGMGCILFPLRVLF